MIRVTAERLRYEASVRGWDQRMLARQAGLSEATISRALAGCPVRGITALCVVQALRRSAPIPELVDLLELPRPPEGMASNAEERSGQSASSRSVRSIAS